MNYLTLLMILNFRRFEKHYLLHFENFITSHNIIWELKIFIVYFYMKYKRIVIIFVIIFSYSIGISQTADNDRKIIKVMTFNILHGATTNESFDLDRIAKVIIDADPDLVSLQEVDYKTNRTKKYDLATELGYRTKMVSLFAKAMSFDGGEYGNAILSKFTFLKTKNVTLPFSEGNEPRTAVEIITVTNSGDTISFIGTHLNHLESGNDRLKQAVKINEIFSSNKYPTILAGDLNDIPKSKTINILEKSWTSSYNKENPQPTFPSNDPEKKIDYVMFLPEKRWKVIETKVIQDSIASDHCSYLVTLELIDENK